MQPQSPVCNGVSCRELLLLRRPGTNLPPDSTLQSPKCKGRGWARLLMCLSGSALPADVAKLQAWQQGLSLTSTYAHLPAGTPRPACPGGSRCCCRQQTEGRLQGSSTPRGNDCSGQAWEEQKTAEYHSSTSTRARSCLLPHTTGAVLTGLHGLTHLQHRQGADEEGVVGRDAELVLIHGAPQVVAHLAEAAVADSCNAYSQLHI